MTEVESGRAARLLYQLPNESRTFIKIDPSLQWTWNEVLQNKMAYLLEILVWQKTKDGAKNRNQPKPFIPDFIEKPKEGQGEAYDIDEIKDILSRPRMAV